MFFNYAVHGRGLNYTAGMWLYPRFYITISPLAPI